MSVYLNSFLPGTAARVAHFTAACFASPRASAELRHGHETLPVHGIAAGHYDGGHSNE